MTMKALADFTKRNLDKAVTAEANSLAYKLCKQTSNARFEPPTSVACIQIFSENYTY